MKTLILGLITLLSINAQRPKWERQEPFLEKDKLLYKELYQLDKGPGACRVWVKKNGGLHLEAIDGRFFADGAIARKTVVELSKSQSGNPTIDLSHYKQRLFNGQWEKDPAESRDDFKGMCAPEAHRLPKSVRISFLGYYGLGVKPKKK